MLKNICPKLPMRDKGATKAFYADKLGFTITGDYPDYLVMQKDEIELHFFLHNTLVPEENYGQVYIRTENIDREYEQIVVQYIKAMPLQNKPWGQREFALLDPDLNLLTFSQSI